MLVALLLLKMSSWSQACEWSPFSIPSGILSPGVSAFLFLVGVAGAVGVDCFLGFVVFFLTTFLVFLVLAPLVALALTLALAKTLATLAGGSEFESSFESSEFESSVFESLAGSGLEAVGFSLLLDAGSEGNSLAAGTGVAAGGSVCTVFFAGSFSC